MDPKRHGEAKTSRPLLKQVAGHLTAHGGRKHLGDAPRHGKAKESYRGHHVENKRDGNYVEIKPGGAMDARPSVYIQKIQPHKMYFPPQIGGQLILSLTEVDAELPQVGKNDKKRKLTYFRAI